MNSRYNITQLLSIKIELEYKPHILTPGLELFLLHLVSTGGEDRGKYRMYSISISIIYITNLNFSYYAANVMSQMVFIKLQKSCV